MEQHGKDPGSEKGQSLTELAITLTLILVLLAGVVDVGRAFFTWTALREAAQEGALYGSTNPTDTIGIELRINNASNLMQGITADPDADLQITITTAGGNCTGGIIRVRVEYLNFPITMPFLGSILGRQTTPITANIIDTILSPACP